MASAQFDHYGVPSSEKKPNSTYIAGAKVHITNPDDHPYRIEFLYFEPGSPMHPDVMNGTHCAFFVPSVEEAVKGQNVIIPPFDVSDKLRCAFIKDGSAVIEIMEKK